MADTPLTFATITAALAQTYNPKVAKQSNRLARTMSLLPWTPFDGKNAAWIVETSGATAAAYAESAAITDRDSDVKVAATLSEGAYRSAFGLTSRGIAGALNSAGPLGLQNLLGNEVMNTARMLASTINQKIFTGTGANEIIGLQTAVDSAGTYATIVPGTHPLWVSTELGNGGTPRDLDEDLMESAIAELITQCGETPDVIVTTPKIWKKYGALARSRRQFVDVISVAAGTIKLIDVGWRALDFDGIPVIADKDCPTGEMYLLNSNHIHGEYLPSALQKEPNSAQYPGIMLTGGDFSGQRGYGERGPMSGQLPADIVVEARAGDRSNVFLRAWPQVVVSRRNAHAKIVDIKET